MCPGSAQPHATRKGIAPWVHPALQRMGHKAPRLEPGDEGPMARQAAMVPLLCRFLASVRERACRHTPPHQPTSVCGFRGPSFPRGNALAYLGHGCAPPEPALSLFELSSPGDGGTARCDTVTSCRSGQSRFPGGPSYLVLWLTTPAKSMSSSNSQAPIPSSLN